MNKPQTEHLVSHHRLPVHTNFSSIKNSVDPFIGVNLKSVPSFYLQGHCHIPGLNYSWPLTLPFCKPFQSLLTASKCKWYHVHPCSKDASGSLCFSRWIPALTEETLHTLPLLTLWLFLSPAVYPRPSCLKEPTLWPCSQTLNLFANPLSLLLQPKVTSLTLCIGMSCLTCPTPATRAFSSSHHLPVVLLLSTPTVFLCGTFLSFSF